MGDGGMEARRDRIGAAPGDRLAKGGNLAQTVSGRASGPPLSRIYSLLIQARAWGSRMAIKLHCHYLYTAGTCVFVVVVAGKVAFAEGPVRLA